MDKRIDIEQLTIDRIYTVLDNKKYKDLLTTKLNEHIDIPFINEATEQFIIENLHLVCMFWVRIDKNKKSQF